MQYCWVGLLSMHIAGFSTDLSADNRMQGLPRESHGMLSFSPSATSRRFSFEDVLKLLGFHFLVLLCIVIILLGIRNIRLACLLVMLI